MTTPTGPSVPNWIAKAVILETGDYSGTQNIVDILSWRATKTQVIVTVQTARGHTERRFRLSNLTEVGHGRPINARLVPDDDIRVQLVQRDMRISSAIRLAQVGAREKLSALMPIEELVQAVGRIQRSATKALAELADLL